MYTSLQPYLVVLFFFFYTFNDLLAVLLGLTKHLHVWECILFSAIIIIPDLLFTLLQIVAADN